MSVENPNYLNDLIEAERYVARQNRFKRTLAASTIAISCFSAGSVALLSEKTGADDGIIEVAVVPFEMDASDATALGATIESSFNEVANGALTVDITVIEPSTAAEQRYEEINSDNCVDKDDLLNYGSYIASTEMFELSKYDKVLALNADPACQDTVGGVAQLSGHYGEVFNAASSWDVIESNGGATVQRRSNSGNATTTTYLYSPAGTGVHEMFHMFGLGHNGTLTPPENRVKGESYSTRIYSESPRDVAIDVREFVTKQTYDEYGSVEVMGKGILDLTKGLSVLEKYILEKALGTQNDISAVDVHTLSAEQLVITGDTPAETVIVHRLQTPIELKNKVETTAMTSLVLIPKQATKWPHAIEGLTAYLVSDGNDSAEIGQIINLGGADSTYTLALGGETLTIDLDYTNEQIILAIEAK